MLEEKTARILLLEPYEIVRKGVRCLIESKPGFTVVGEASDGLEALRMIERLKPDVIVLELVSKGIGGLELLQQLHHRNAETRSVVLSEYRNEVYVTQALRAGAQAYVLKESAVDELLSAIERVAAGQSFLCAELTRYAFDGYWQGSNGNHNGNHDGNHDDNSYAAADPYQTLSPRECEVLHLLIREELSSSSIAKRLFISRRTVETHRAHIMRKLNVRSYPNLIRYAIQNGLIPRIEEAGYKDVIPQPIFKQNYIERVGEKDATLQPIFQQNYAEVNR